MKVYRTTNNAVLVHEDKKYMIPVKDWDSFINRTNLFQKLLDEIKGLSQQNVDLESLQLQKLTKNQEIWASGVTYMRSKKARVLESEKAGGGTFYDKVYDAARPELFFKSTPERAVGNGEPVRIRKDSTWNVPEPELTLFMSSEGTIEGYTIGNDMSSRSIEGENPLYLPQAKTYDGCAAIGPCLYLSEKPISADAKIHLEILRNNKTVFEDSIAIDQMKRTHKDLVSYLFMECSFPKGVFLMTGTGIVPPDDFTLQAKDEIKITIDEIGTLVNSVA